MFEQPPSGTRYTDGYSCCVPGITDFCANLDSLEQSLFGLLTKGRQQWSSHRKLLGEPAFGSAAPVDLGRSYLSSMMPEVTQPPARESQEVETRTIRQPMFANGLEGTANESAESGSSRKSDRGRPDEIPSDRLHFSFSGWESPFGPFGMNEAGLDIETDAVCPISRDDLALAVSTIPANLSSGSTPARVELQKTSPRDAKSSFEDGVHCFASSHEEDKHRPLSSPITACGTPLEKTGCDTIWEMDRTDYYALSPTDRKRVRNRVSARVARTKHRKDFAFLSGNSLPPERLTTEADKR